LYDTAVIASKKKKIEHVRMLAATGLLLLNTRLKTLRMYQDVGGTDQQKAGKQDSIKQISTQLHSTHLSTILSS